MLLNFKVEIVRHNLSAAQIADFLKINTKTMSQKITEKSQFTRDEMYKIYDQYFRDVDFHYLFMSDKGGKTQ